MTSKQIYRIENAKGDGPFQGSIHHPTEFAIHMAQALGWLEYEERWDGTSDGFKKDHYVRMYPDDTHPHHMDDVAPPDFFDPHIWKVGCKDEAQLNHWFPEQSFAFFAENGFEMVIYECECDHIHFGHYQLLFCIDNVTVVERKALV